MENQGNVSKQSEDILKLCNKLQNVMDKERNQTENDQLEQQQDSKRSYKENTSRSVIKDGHTSNKSFERRNIQRSMTRKQVTQLISQGNLNINTNVDDLDLSSQYQNSGREDFDENDSNSSQISFLNEKYQTRKQQERLRLKRLIQTFKEETNQAGQDGDPYQDEEFSSTIYQHLPILQDIQNEQIEEENDILYGDEYIDEKHKVGQNLSLDVIPMNAFEKINAKEFNGFWPNIKKSIQLSAAMVSFISYKIIKSFMFEVIVLLIILTNSVVLAMDSHESKQNGDQLSILESFDTIFLILYSIEMVLKILGLGFIFNRGAYLRDPWNILDFIIVVTAYPSLILDSNSGIDLSALRSLRVLRPLRTISSIKALRAILVALFSAFKLLANSIVMLLFFFMIFAIGGLQLFSGLLKKRCFYQSTGIMYDQLIDDDPYCNDTEDCDKYYQNDGNILICGKMNENPNWGITNFDTFGWSFLQIFQIVTLEGWSEIMYGITKTYSYLVTLLFLLIVFIGAFFLMNLTLAIIKIKFSSAQDEIAQDDNSTKKKKNEEEEGYNIALLKDFGIYKSKKIGYDPDQIIDNNGSDSQQEIFTGKGVIQRQNSTDIRNQGAFLQKINQLKRLKRNSESESDNDCATSKDNNNKLNSSGGNNQQHLKYTKSGFANIVIHPNSSHNPSASHQSPVDGPNFATLNQSQQQSDDPLTILRNARRISIANTISPYSLRRQFTSKEQSQIQQKSNLINYRQKHKFTGAVRATISVNRFKSSKALGMDINDEQLAQIKKAMKSLKSNKISVKKYQQKQTKTIQQKTNTGKIHMQGVLINNYRSTNKKKTHVYNQEKSAGMVRQKKNSQISGSFVSQYGNRLQTGSSRRELTLGNDEIKSDLGDIDFDQIPKEAQIQQNVNEIQGVNINILNLRQKQKNNQQNQQQIQQQQQLSSNQNIKSPISSETISSQQQIIPLKKTKSNNQDKRDSRILLQSEENNFVIERKQSGQNLNPNLINNNLTVQSSGLPPRNNNSSNNQRLDTNNIYRRYSKKGSYKMRNNSRVIRNKETSIIDTQQDMTPSVSQAGIGSYSHSDCNEEDSEESYDINNPSQKLYMQDDEDFTAEMKYNFKVHESLGALTQAQKKNDFKRKQSVLQHKKRKTVKKHSQSISKKMTLQLEDQDGEMARLKTILDSRYLKCRVQCDYQPLSIDDIVPSKKEKERKIKLEQKTKEMAEKKFRFKYDFEGTIAKKEASKNKQVLSERNKQILAPKMNQISIRKSKRGEYLSSQLFVAKVQQIEDYTLSQVERILNNQARQKDTYDQYQKISELYTGMLFKIDKKKERQEAAAVMDMTFIMKNYFESEEQAQGDNNNNQEQKQLKKNLNSFSSLKQAENVKEEGKGSNNENNNKNNNNSNKEGEEDEGGGEGKKKGDKDMDMVLLYDKEVEEQFEQKPNHKGFCEHDVSWSGEDVRDIVPFCLNQNKDQLNKFGKILLSINFGVFDYEMWEGGIYGIIQAFRRIVLKIVLHQYFDYFIMLCVILNTLILALDGLVSEEGSQLLDDFNLVFTIIFTVDMGLKLIGMGVLDYVRDTMNLFDGVIVILSLVELAITSGKKKSAISAFRSVRIFRTFRVLRVTKLIRSLRYMQIIIEVIVKSISSFFYIFMLLILFCYIYALLGMQAFGGKFDFDDAPRMNFDSFTSAFMAVYQIMTMENWTDLLFACMRTDQYKIITLLYLISWIFVGNYVLLNLFLSILLDSFDEQASANDDLTFEIGEDLQLENEQNNLIKQQSTMTSTSKMGQSNQTTALPLTNGINVQSPAGQQQQQFDGSINVFPSQYIRQDTKTNSNPMGQSFPNRTNRMKQVISSTMEGEDTIKEIGEEDILAEIEGDSMIKDKIEKKKEFIMFENIECDKSYFIISKNNFFRKFCYRSVKHEHFESVILIAIILSSLKLIVDTYVEKGNPDWDNIDKIGKIVDYFFTGFFFLEALLKATAFGFFMDKNSYLRESWSQLDCFIVIASLFDVFMTINSDDSEIDLSQVKILRLLRILRPLRFISHNKNMKIVVTALLESVPAVLNVLIVVLLIWMMFAILGINLMKDALWYCKLPDNYGDGNEDLIYEIGKEQCDKINGAEWTTYDMNFDNIFNAMMTLFVLSTLEGWPDYMWQFVDAQEPDLDGNSFRPPSKNNNELFMLYFVVFIFIGSMFLLNLFIGVVQLNFMLAENSAKNKYLTDDQTKWIELQKQILKSVPDYSSLKPPKNFIRKQIWYFCQGILDTIIMTCIILNIITMAITYESETEGYNNVLTIINYVFTGVFILECVLKLTAYGMKGYFTVGWNRFDFFVVCTSIMDIFMTISSNGITFLKVGPQLGRVFRVLRVTRLFRLVKAFEELKKLIQVTILTLPQLMNIAALLFLVFFIFSILGCFLFKDITNGDIINDYVNFQNFHTAFILLFQCSTGEDWHKAMFDTMGHEWYYSAYFIVFVVLIQFIMINLFILIILNNFGDNFINTQEDNPITAFQDIETSFKQLWNVYTKQENGIKLDSNKLTDFYLDLEEPLGLDWKKKKQQYIEQMKLHRDITQKEIDQNVAAERTRLYIIASQILMHMEVIQDQHGYIYFNDMMFFLYRNFFKDKIEFEKREDIMKRQPHIKDEEEAIDNYDESLKIIEKEEKATLKKSEKLKKKMNRNFKTRGNNLPSANPMVRVMFVNMAYRAWLNHSILYFEKKQNEKQKGEEGEIPEVLTSTDSNSSENSSEEDEQQQDIDEETSMIEKKKKQNKKIIQRAHQQLKYLEEKYPNLKYKNVLKINTDIYQEEDGYFQQPDNIYQDYYNDDGATDLQQMNTARSKETNNSDQNYINGSQVFKNKQPVQGLQPQQEQQQYAINMIVAPEDGMQQSQQSPNKKQNGQYSFSEGRRQQQNTNGKNNNIASNNNPILSIKHNLKQYSMDVKMQRNNSLGTPFNAMSDNDLIQNDLQKKQDDDIDNDEQQSNDKDKQQVINYNIQNNIIINNNYYYNENNEEQNANNPNNMIRSLSSQQQQQQQQIMNSQDRQQQQSDSRTTTNNVRMMSNSGSLNIIQSNNSNNNNNNSGNNHNQQQSQ